MKKLQKILVLTDSESILASLKSHLIDHFQVQAAQFFELSNFESQVNEHEFVLIDYLIINDFSTQKNSDDQFYKEKLTLLKNLFRGARIILFAPQKLWCDAGDLIRLGFDNLIQVPFNKEVLLHRLSVESERLKFKEISSNSPSARSDHNALFETNNEGFLKELKKLEIAAKSKSTILITGESGTGKSLLAKHIHQLSDRNEQRFISVHCGAIPETLVESELFGHEKGAFTGAIRKKIGKFELADQGSVFLDEIGTIVPSVQVRLLQVLQEKFIQRVGGEADIPLDIRVIAATNLNLKNAVKSGVFREDLFYRLNVFSIEIPPLRARKEDIERLAYNLVRRISSQLEKNIQGISREALGLLRSYDWPGNVRELENVLERAVVLEQGNEISVENIPRDLLLGSREIGQISPLTDVKLGLIEARKRASEIFERTYLTELLLAHSGKVSAMAAQAQVSVRQLHKLMAKHDIRAKDFSIKLSGNPVPFNSFSGSPH